MVISIDLGSNTIRALKIDCDSGEVTGEFERVVRTAEGLAQSGMIGRAAIDRVIAAIKKMQTQLGFDGCKIRAVTTEAMRRASNSAEVIEQINKSTGIKLEIITGKEEARLSLKAATYALKRANLSSDSYVLIDIGGGSTEISFYDNSNLVSRSFPIGIVTASEKLGKGDDIDKFMDDLMADAQKFVKEVYIKIDKPELFLATAGTPTTIAALEHGLDYKSYDSEIVNGTRLKQSQLRFWLNKLLQMNTKQREVKVGVGRADLIVMGVYIYDRLYQILGFDESIVIDDGLREGVAMELCGA